MKTNHFIDKKLFKKTEEKNSVLVEMIISKDSVGKVYGNKQIFHFGTYKVYLPVNQIKLKKKGLDLVILTMPTWLYKKQERLSFYVLPKYL